MRKNSVSNQAGDVSETRTFAKRRIGRLILSAIAVVCVLAVAASFGTMVVSAEETVPEATTAATEAVKTSLKDSLIGFIVPLAAFGLIAYFFLIRPERKRKKEAQTLRDTLKPGDKITTIGGITGTVAIVTDETITLRNGLVLQRWALRTIDSSAEVSEDTDESDEPDKE